MLLVSWLFRVQLDDQMFLNRQCQFFAVRKSFDFGLYIVFIKFEPTGYTSPRYRLDDFPQSDLLVLLFSFKVISSPTETINEGMLTFLPLTRTCLCLTSARSSCSRALSRLDLPTLGTPAMTTEIPSRRIRPWSAEASSACRAWRPAAAESDRDGRGRRSRHPRRGNRSPPR